MTVFQSLLNSTGILYKRHRSEDGRGGWEIDYELDSAIECRMRPASSSERTVAQSEERQITHVLYTEIDEDIARGDRFLVDGVLVDIDALRKPSRENNYLALEHLEFDCLEKQYEENEIDFVLLLETGDFRLLETGGIRLLE